MNMMVRSTTVVVAQHASVRKLLNEILHSEVLPALIKFNNNVRPVSWTANDPAIADLRLHILNSQTDENILWSFADRASILSVPQLAEKATGVLGVTKDMFWCIVLHYALWQGLRDYKAVHKGLGPEDFEAYLYAMLTCDNPGEEIRKDF